ncbi:MAG: hypothetical protein ACK5NB_10350 [Flavobacteriaceae bacterium]
MKIKVLITLFACFKVFSVFAQMDTLRVDENNRPISKYNFYKKEKSPLYSGFRFSTDTLIIEKLRYNYFFGKIESPKKEQILKLFSKRHQIDTSKTLVIHYLDTLKSINDYPKRSRTIFYDSLGQEVKHSIKLTHMYSGLKVDASKSGEIARHKHILNHKDFFLINKRCVKSYKRKKNVEVLHFFGVNMGHPEAYKKIKWYKDYGFVLGKIFADKTDNFKNIILRPNGEFYVSDYYMSVDEVSLRLKNWDKEKENFYQTIKSFSKI